ncbi:AMP-binding protein [Bradyrhizobium manausense]|uniref:class I adenylate-forming enzyme family protein n=1 Tax=Bradyrhizobium manausense TaxID=989370 RepID=UPI001BAACC1D|nr:AMP-binding protein [Bradyrhizobium manausense]MBR0684315.1 AMP-binding protein [Bradyrhizobium manausense]
MSSAATTQDRPAFFDISARVAEHGRLRPSGEALVFEGRRIDWRTLNTRVNRLANLLLSQGIEPNKDKVAILASPSAAYVETFLGVLRAGCCLVPLSPMASTDQLINMIRDAGVKALFISNDLRDLAGVFPSDLAPMALGKAVAIDFAAAGWASYEELLNKASDKAVDVPITPEMDFNIIYSSGTTSEPKGIVHDHAARTANLDLMTSLGYGPGCRTLLATPLYSNLTIAAFLPTMGLGGTIVLMRKFDAAAYLDLAESEHITHTMLVPVQYERLLADTSFSGRDLSSFQLKSCTSAPLRTTIKREIVERWPGKLLEIYGMTEGGGLCMLDATANRDKLDTVGKPAFGAEYRIIDDDGNELPQGQIGEIACRGRVMMKGYHNRPAATAAIIWRDATGKEFFKTGDMGYFDSDGFLHLSDRKKDMIISGGFNIYAADLEEVLLSHPGVIDAAVVAVPSAEWGETPFGFVVLRAGAIPSRDELKDWANSRLGKAQRIFGIDIIESLPRSAIGKVLKRELRDNYRRVPT